MRKCDADNAASINNTRKSHEKSLFPLGILSAHAGDLPRCRGNACQAWATLNGKSRVGLCIHRMIGRELDSLDVLSRSYMPRDLTSKVSAVMNWLWVTALELMQDEISRLAAFFKYIPEPQSQDAAHALRCYPRSPEGCVYT